MRESSVKVVAVDCGAGSLRYALGTLSEGVLTYEVIEQVPNNPLEVGERIEWDFGLLSGFCEKALSFAQSHGASGFGIDTWGVDHGFLGRDGGLLQNPVAYRDASHTRAAESIAGDTEWLYGQTGIQRQPFNTLYQLLARREEKPALFAKGNQWLLLPDLLLYHLGAPPGYEWSMASTTQLTDSLGQWNTDVLGRYGLPEPAQPVGNPSRTGVIHGGVELIRIAGHDTACAVAGMGDLTEAAFLNIGTWALIGEIGPFDPSAEALALNLTHERTWDNQVRRLCNVPGMFIADRVYQELDVKQSKADWLQSAERSDLAPIAVFDPSLYNPHSMVTALTDLNGQVPDTPSQWSGWVLESLVDGIISRIPSRSKRIRLTGGASKLPGLCQRIANHSGLPVQVGPSEATLLGNMAIQLHALGVIESVEQTVGKSITIQEFHPGGAL